MYIEIRNLPFCTIYLTSSRQQVTVCKNFCRSVANAMGDPVSLVSCIIVVTKFIFLFFFSIKIRCRIDVEMTFRRRKKRSPQLYHRNDYTRNQYSVMDFKSLESKVSFTFFHFHTKAGWLKTNCKYSKDGNFPVLPNAIKSPLNLSRSP